MLVRAVFLGCLVVGALGAGAVVCAAPGQVASVGDWTARFSLESSTKPPASMARVELVERPQPEEGPRLASLEPSIIEDEVDGAAANVELEEQEERASDADDALDGSSTEATPAPPAPAESGDPEQLSAERFLAAIAQETVVYERPDRRSSKLGLLRAGALVGRAAVPVHRRGCRGGWYRIAPVGYVCVGRAATLDVEHPIVQLTAVRADRGAPLPYAYGRARPPVRPVLYTRLPTADEQSSVEKDLAGIRSQKLDAAWNELAGTAGPPTMLAHGERVPRPYGHVASGEVTEGFAVMNSAFAFVDLFEAEGRKWGLTTELALVPLDRVAKLTPSEFHGVAISGTHTLPLAFVRSSGAVLYVKDAATGALRGERAVVFREAFALSGQAVRFAGEGYVETADGHYLRDKALVRIEPPKQLPRFAKPGQTWIDVSILKQTLVAYEGERPVYATLVSTGKDGLGDPLTTHSTVQGTFRIHTKHVTATMSGDEADDEFDLHDVPYVQYFHEGFALHAAYWHEGFGAPRSHGCVNLSPEDARWLFSWTDPPVPQAWHSALSNEGTIVYVHP